LSGNLRAALCLSKSSLLASLETGLSLALFLLEIFLSLIFLLELFLKGLDVSLESLFLEFVVRL
jgi:hypothetical protein